MALAVQLITTLACGIYELHRASEGIENPLPRIAHRYVYSFIHRYIY